MPMTSTRYVTQMPDGAFMVVYDGNVTYTETQQEAEQLFNQLEAQSGSVAGSQTGTRSPSWASGNPGYWPALGDSLNANSQQDFDEMVRQFNEQQRLASQGQYANLATSLLSGATSLRGPADWLNYAQFTNGGRNIFQQLYGNTPAPAFGAPTGYSNPATIQDILAALGLGPPAAGTTPGQGTGQATGGDSLSVPTQRSGQSGAGGPSPMNYTPGPTVPTTPPAGPGATNPNMAPLPYQINPGVWDSLSSTAKQMILASAEKGNTPSGAWSAEDYLGQLNASRPKGYAPRQVAYNWGASKPLY